MTTASERAIQNSTTLARYLRQRRHLVEHPIGPRPDLPLFRPRIDAHRQDQAPRRGVGRPQHRRVRGAQDGPPGRGSAPLKEAWSATSRMRGTPFA